MAGKRWKINYQQSWYNYVINGKHNMLFTGFHIDMKNYFFFYFSRSSGILQSIFSGKTTTNKNILKAENLILMLIYCFWTLFYYCDSVENMSKWCFMSPNGELNFLSPLSAEAIDKVNLCSCFIHDIKSWRQINSTKKSLLKFSMLYVWRGDACAQWGGERESSEVDLWEMV